MAKNVLIISNSASGLYQLRLELLKALSEAGSSITLVIPDDGQCVFFEDIGCKIIRVSVDRRGMNPIKDIRLFLNYRKTIKQVKPDVVLLYTVKPNVYGGMACRFSHTPYIATITGLGTALANPGLLQKIVLKLYKTGLRDASAIMFQNKSGQEFFRSNHIGKNYCLVAGSGVNLNKYTFEPYPSDNSEIRLIYVGRIMRDKGVYELLEAAEKCKKKHPNIQFDIIGPYEEDMRAVVEKYVREGYVNYLGRQSNMNDFYKNCWAVIMPSYHEGICNVCLEAAATGRPLIASNIPGCQETFDEGVSGLGFEPKNSEALYKTLERFLDLPYEQKTNMGRAGRKKMEKEFDRNTVVQSYMNEIVSIVGDK